MKAEPNQAFEPRTCLARVVLSYDPHQAGLRLIFNLRRHNHAQAINSENMTTT